MTEPLPFAEYDAGLPTLRQRLYVALVEQRVIDSRKYGEAPYAPITWEEVDRCLTPPDQQERPSLMEILGNVKVRMWACPIEAHARPGEQVVTVEWVDGVAYCTFPGCAQSSVTPPGRVTE